MKHYQYDLLLETLHEFNQLYDQYRTSILNGGQKAGNILTHDEIAFLKEVTVPFLCQQLIRWVGLEIPQDIKEEQVFKVESGEVFVLISCEGMEDFLSSYKMNWISALDKHRVELGKDMRIEEIVNYLARLKVCLGRL